MPCFTNILNIFFSFVTYSKHKNPHQNEGNGIKETLFFKIFLGSMPLDSPRGSRAFGASRANSCPPPQISKPVRLCCIAFFNLQFIPFMLHQFCSWALFIKFDRNRFLRTIFLRVLSFPAGGLPNFGTSVRQTVDGDGGMRSRKHSSNYRITLLILSVLK